MRTKIRATDLLLKKVLEGTAGIKRYGDNEFYLTDLTLDIERVHGTVFVRAKNKAGEVLMSMNVPDDGGSVITIAGFDVRVGFVLEGMK